MKPRLKTSRDGVPKDAREWLEDDWAVLHQAIEHAKAKIVDRHRQPTEGAPQDGPVGREYYDPQEVPTAYPLELTSGLHVCLWDAAGLYKWTIAMWVVDREGYDLRFIGGRPFDSRVDWSRFGEVVGQGQGIADARFAAEEAAS